MKTRNLVYIVILILAAVVAGGWWWRSQARAASTDGRFEAAGTIEARQVRLAPEIGGKVLEVLVAEGESVSAGQPLVRLDEALLVSQRDQAQAALQAAQAKLALLEAGATDEQIQAAEAQLAQAEANLQMVQASLEVLTAGTRPEEIESLRASLNQSRDRYRDFVAVFTSDQVEQVREALTTAEGNLSEAKLRKDELARNAYNPDFVVASAEATIVDAQAALNAAQNVYDAITDKDLPYFKQAALAQGSREVANTNLALAQAHHEGLKQESRSTQDGLEAAKASHEDAQEQLDAAEAAYQAITAGVSAEAIGAAWDEVQRTSEQLSEVAAANPSTGSTSVEPLLAQVDAAGAARDTAAANLASLQNGTRPEEILAAQAQVAAAQAQLKSIDVQIEKLIIASPGDGVVLTRNAEPGQMAPAGAPLLEIGRLDRLELTVYLPEQHLGLVSLGQMVDVRVNAYPKQVFSGKVLRLSDRAEFTPTNIQTKEDRTRLVYALVIELDNPDLALKPGMIADVEFEE